MLDIPQGAQLWTAVIPMAEEYSERFPLQRHGRGLISMGAGSDVLYLNFLGADHIILNSSEAILDLSDKRSGIYSGRVSCFRIRYPLISRLSWMTAAGSDVGAVSNCRFAFQPCSHGFFKRVGIYPWSLPLSDYGDRWRSGRRLLHEFLNVKAARDYDDQQCYHTRDFILRLAESPENLWDHLKL